MTQEAITLRDNLRRSEQALNDALDRVRQLEASCVHVFTKPAYHSHKVSDGYMSQNLMGHFTTNADGSINAPQTWVEARYDQWWERECQVCGKVEKTRKTEEVVEKSTVPKF